MVWAQWINLKVQGKKIWTLGVGKIVSHQLRLSLLNKTTSQGYTTINNPSIPMILAGRHLKLSNSLESSKRTTSKSTSKNHHRALKNSSQEMVKYIQRSMKRPGKNLESHKLRGKEKSEAKEISWRWKEMNLMLIKWSNWSNSSPSTLTLVNRHRKSVKVSWLTLQEC